MADPTEPTIGADASATAPAAVTPAATTTPEATTAEPAEASEQQAAASEPTEGGEHDAEDGGEDASAEGGETADAASEGGEAGKKKRRRRRKKKGGAQTSAGTEGAPGGEGEARPRKKENPNAPFQRFFAGANAGKRHGFAVGEVVAGRVKEVAHGVIVVDLFGKALAFADEHEPREVPVIAQPEPAEASAEPATAEATAAPEVEAAVSSEASAALAELRAEAAEGEAAQAPAGDAGAASVGAAPEAVATDAPETHDEPTHPDLAAAEQALESAHEEHEDEHEESAGGRGPTTPLPLVPESAGRPDAPAVGSVFRGRVGLTSESGHIALVNRILDPLATVAQLEQCRITRRRVEGLVFGFNRGGFDVMVAGFRAFCPASAMSLGDIGDPHEHVGRKYEFLLPAGQSVVKDIIVSRRSILERQQRKLARELIKNLQPGQRVKGRVTHVRDFGVLVDIGGVEGLVHVSELSWSHGVRAEDVCKPGDEVEVQVLRIGGEPGRSGEHPQRRDRVTRIGLSIKALLPDPWDAHAEALSEGSVVKGKVTRTTDFGAFIQLAPDIEGLLHITELGRDLKHANQAINEGDEIYVVVERLDRRARRISLSRLSASEVKDFEAGTLEEGMRSVRPGARVTVTVERIEPQGLVVRLQGVVGKRARGFVPRSEMGENRGADLRKLHPQGSTLDVKIVGVDRDGGLRCSPKALQVDDERKAIKDYRREASKQGFGTFGDLLKAKLGEAGPK